LGLNDAELKANKVLTEYVVRDLNVDPSLPYEDNSFDVIVNAVSQSILQSCLSEQSILNVTFQWGCGLLAPTGLLMVLNHTCLASWVPLITMLDLSNNVNTVALSCQLTFNFDFDPN
jgi:hypothetical protein